MYYSPLATILYMRFFVFLALYLSRFNVLPPLHIRATVIESKKQSQLFSRKHAHVHRDIPTMEVTCNHQYKLRKELLYPLIVGSEGATHDLWTASTLITRLI